MKTTRLLLFSLILLAACNQDDQVATLNPNHAIPLEPRESGVSYAPIIDIRISGEATARVYCPLRLLTTDHRVTDHLFSQRC